MKIHSIILKNDDVVESVKEAAINTAFAVGRLYTVLHKQFWLKDRMYENKQGYMKLATGQTIYNDGNGFFPTIKPRINTLDYTITYKNRPCKAILFYNIENMTNFGYDPNDLSATGLPSLFNEQNPVQDLAFGGESLSDFDVANIVLKEEDFYTPLLPIPSYKIAFKNKEGNLVERYVKELDSYGEILVDDVVKIDNFEERINVPEPIAIVTNEIVACENSSPIYAEEQTIVGYEAPAAIYEDDVLIGYEEPIPIYGYEIVACSLENDDFTYEEKITSYEIPEPETVQVYIDSTINVIKDNTIIESFNIDNNEEFTINYGYHKTDIRTNELGNKIDAYEYYINPTFDDSYGTLEHTEDVDTVVYKYTHDEYHIEWHRVIGGEEYNGVGLESHPTKARIYIFSSGIAIQIVPPLNHLVEEDAGGQTIEVRGATKTKLPLMYEDTGDLVMNRYDFVENWSDMFEIYTKNFDDSPWWKDVLGIVIVFVATILTWGYGTSWWSLTLTGAEAVTTALFVAGTFIGGMGAISGNSIFKAIGLVLSLYASYQSISERGLAESYKAQGLTEKSAAFKAKALIMEQSFGDTFSYFLDGLSFNSFSGMSNLLSMGDSINGIITLTEQQTDIMSNEEINETEEKGSYYVEENEEDDVVGYINEVLEVNNTIDI